MTKPREKGQTLSVGAKSYIEGLAKSHVYGITREFATKETLKGQIVEPDSLALLNEVLFTSFTKNTQHFENDWIMGTPDIIGPDRVHDLKSSWSISSFPANFRNAYDSGYEWQVRGYMMLTDRDASEIDYCLVDTPDELIGFEDEAVHKVSHIDPLLRVTRVPYERDRNLEEFIKFQAEEAQKYFKQAVEEIYSIHN